MPGIPERSLRGLFILALLLFPATLHAEDRMIADLFIRKGVEGCMVISSLDGSRNFIHHAERARHRYPPASTFKILNTLIALEEGAIGGKAEVIRWDGRNYDIPDWNRDQTLESAFRVSCVWYFQELARRVGSDRYRDYVVRCGYGELNEPFDGSTFWLDGSLQISAMEQVRFLRRLCNRDLPFRASSFETLRELMVVGNAPGYVLRAKSGWFARSVPQVGWYVGYVERAGQVWLFAMNMDIRNQEELPMRQQLVLEALRARGIID